MTSANVLSVTLLSDLEVKLTREFEAPRELVFEAFSRPEHIQQWWGQAASSMVVDEMDFRPGGAWRFVERAADGQEYAFRGEYRDIQRPERIVWTFEWEGLPGHVSVETMVFEDLGPRTRIVGTTVFDSMADRDGMVQSGMERGAAESYNRLDTYLETLARA